MPVDETYADEQDALLPGDAASIFFLGAKANDAAPGMNVRLGPKPAPGELIIVRPREEIPGALSVLGQHECCLRVCKSEWDHASVNVNVRRMCCVNIFI